MLLRSIIVIVFLYFVTTQISAFTVFNLDNSSFSMRKPTEVYIVGFGDGVGDQFLKTALTRAKRHQEINPENQQLIIWAKEKSKSSDVNNLRNKGFRPFEANKRNLMPEDVFRTLRKLRTIKSLHIIAHNAAWHGAGLQENVRLNYDHEGWTQIQPKLKDGYVFLHGCNTGFVYAPRLSKKLNIPVFGSIGSTDFQQLHNDGLWYHNNKGQYPDGGWSRTNELSYVSQMSCSSGYCHRLQPDLFHYSGKWGSYKSGLPFYKAFCNFNTNSRGMKKCNKALVHALNSWPSVHADKLDNWQSIDEKLIDFLCPIHSSMDARKNCLEVLNRYKSGSLSEVTTFYGNDANCYLSGCDLTIKKIKLADRSGMINGFFSKDNKNQTLVREYQLYKNAFSGVTKRRVPQAKVNVEN
jgi:hypothetical protein